MQTSSTCSTWPKRKDSCFNSKKCAIKQESITFFGGVFLAEGYSPDPEKIQGISEIDTTPDEARATIIPRSSELSPDIRSPP